MLVSPSFCCCWPWLRLSIHPQELMWQQAHKYAYQEALARYRADPRSNSYPLSRHDHEVDPQKYLVMPSYHKIAEVGQEEDNQSERERQRETGCCLCSSIIAFVDIHTLPVCSFHPPFVPLCRIRTVLLCCHAVAPLCAGGEGPRPARVLYAAARELAN